MLNSKRKKEALIRLNRSIDTFMDGLGDSVVSLENAQEEKMGERALDENRVISPPYEVHHITNP